MSSLPPAFGDVEHGRAAPLPQYRASDEPRRSQRGWALEAWFALLRGAAGVATAPPSVQDERGFGKEGKQGMVAVASGTRQVVAALGSLLVSSALEDGAVQIETEAIRRHRPGECEQPFPKWPSELFDVALAEADEEVAHGVGARKSLNAQQGVMGFEVEVSRICRPGKMGLPAFCIVW